MRVAKKRVMVVGMARSGIAAAQLLLRHGAKPVLYDEKTADALGEVLAPLRGTACEFHLGEDPCVWLKSCDLVVISPGVPIDSPVVKAARERGIPLIGELELGYALAQGDVLAVTGTNGKTTTVTLLGKMFENAGIITHVAGNIGYPLSAAALNSRKSDVIITEVSSFQLETIRTFHPCVAAILNITQDHLNRHGTMEQYIRLKQRIFENQTSRDVAVINMDDPILVKTAEKIKPRVAFFSRTQPVQNGAFVENGKIVWRWDGEQKPVCDADKVLIPGLHNLENALAATAMAACRGVPAAVIRHTLQTFTGVEHRIEKVRVFSGVTFINDSKGTNVDSTVKAVQSMQAPTVLILGGYDKHTDFMPLCQGIVASGRISHIVVMGETAEQIADTLRSAGYTDITQAYSLEDAVHKARAAAVPGGNVLLSPACASFDMFRDYEQRGEVFKQIVNTLG
ncbi:MAG: UDP-N-acetylmuramoyl-L-alanine--D-glutamate ligase [Eubacteriales bacterium]|nr:UDP-N-acetylmuramoyl-L-alanine--D-glutamate ligase [Eubacteriales bacterium]